MKRRRTIYVVLDGFSSLMSGHGSHEIVEAVTGRAPCWSHHRRGWVVQESTARDCIAVIEQRGWDCVITGPRAAARAEAATVSDETTDPGRGLW